MDKEHEEAYLKSQFEKDLRNASAIKILDTFLKKFESLRSRNYNATLDDFSKFGLSINDIILVLHKLKDDKYVYNPDATHYMLTFKGRYFSETGGYSTSYEMEKHQKKIQNLKDWLLILGTWLAGIGAIGLIIWEIAKTFCFLSE